MGTKIIDGILEVTKSGTSNNSVVRKEELQKVIEMAEGKCKTYVLSYLDNIESCKNLSPEEFFVYNFSTNEWENKYEDLMTGAYDSYKIINNNFNSTASCLMEAGENYLIVRSINNEQVSPSSNYTSRYLLSLSWRDVGNLLPNVGDIFLVIETNVPDRWYGGGATPYHFYQLETTKVDLTADNQTVKTGSVTFGANDTVEFVAGTNISISGDATNKQITISATDNDTKVTQNTITTENANLPVLLAMNNSGAEQTGTVNKTSTLLYNPSTKELKVDGTKVSLEGHTHAYTPASVLPADTGELKTKYRIAKKDHTGGAGTYWYYEICKLPKNDSGNYASAIISGRIGGWESGNMSYINALIWNRNTPGLAVIDVGGTATAASTIWSVCDLVLYTNSDGTATLYAKCANWFTFDLDLELFQSTATITYSGNKLTSVSGTFNSSASTTTSRMELINGELYVSGTKVSKDGHNHDDRYYTESEIDTKLASLGGGGGTSNEVLETFKVYDENYGYITLSFGQDALDDEGTIKLDSPSGHTTYGVSSIVRRSDYDGKTYDYGFPSKNGTIALTSDIQANTWRPIGTGASDAAAGNHTHTTNAAIYVDSANRLHAAGFYSNSDKRLKEDIREYQPKNSILDLPVVEFKYKDTKQHTLGCIAQDLQEICPEIVYTDDKGFLTIEESKLTYLLLLELKKVKAETDELKAEIKKLKGE